MRFGSQIATPAPGDASHLLERVDRPLEVVEEARREHDVEAVVGERDVVDVADLEQVGDGAALDHVLGQLEAGDRGKPLRPPVGEHAGAGADVEHAGVVVDAELRRRTSRSSGR